MSKTSTISSFLKKWPLHLLLLPVFFILNIHVQFGGLLQFSDLALAFIKTTVGLFLFFGLLYLWYRDRNKAAVGATIAGILFLYFGPIKEAGDKLPLFNWLTSYTILLPLLPIASIFFLYRIKKIKSLATASLFLNILFMIYLGIEVYKWNRINRYLQGSDDSPLSFQSSSNSTQQLPGIYYILIDSYPSSGYQREVLGVAQNSLDSLLTTKGFFVIPDSRSNYNLTPFSMASILGMQYLDWMKQVVVKNPSHYSHAATAIKNAVLFDWLQKNNYTIYNLSIFDLPGHPSMNKERFFTELGTEVIFFGTFWSKARWHILPYFFPSLIKESAVKQQANLRQMLEHFKPYNANILDSLVRMSSSQDHVQRKFVYAHLEMPHYPYFYDSAGHAYPDEIAYSRSSVTDKKMFREYISYTNYAINKLLDSMLAKNKGRDVIVLQSDHGTRNLDETRPKDAFRNYSAFYFPDRDYHLLYPGMSNVNTFRIIFNKYFGQQLPLLKDSSINVK
jgi:hypothetical protein